LIIEVALAAKHSPFDSFIGIWGSVIADSLVALGVFGELLFSAIGSKRHGELQRRSKLMVAEANQKASEANARASEANQKAQEAILELADLRAPRALTREQRGRVVDKLKQFSGTEYDITVSGADPEILSFVFTIELVLSTAEWAELDWKGDGQGLIREGMPIIRLGASVTNVIVGVHVSQPLKLWECALALSDALMAEDIDATAGRHTPHVMSSTNANAIHIFIGRKI
jgi:hypothetical protein